MDNRFLKGIFIGLVCSVLLILLVIGGYFLVSRTMGGQKDTRITGSVIQDQGKPADGAINDKKVSDNGSSASVQSGALTTSEGEQDENNMALTEEEQKELFDKKFELIKKYIDYYYYQDYDMDAVYDYMFHAMVDALGDPYSEYYSPNEYSDVVLNSNGNYSGIGAVVTQYTSDYRMYILYPYENSPAYEAGLKPMDEIVAVNGEDVIGWNLDDVVALMRGPEGTDVVLTIVRNETEWIDVPMTRREIILNYVVSRMLDDNIGYIYYSQFTTSGAEQFTAALKELKAQDMKGLIVDLRDNPGGMVDACVDMIDQILPAGMVAVFTEDKQGHREY